MRYIYFNNRESKDIIAQMSKGKQFFQEAGDMHAKTMEREERALQAGMKELKIEGEIITLNTYLSKGIEF